MKRKKMNLSSVNEGGVLTYMGDVGIVVSRWPDDRVSGGTVVQWEHGGRQMFVWDKENPQVYYHGQGTLTLSIVLDG